MRADISTCGYQPLLVLARLDPGKNTYLRKAKDNRLYSPNQQVVLPHTTGCLSAYEGSCVMSRLMLLSDVELDVDTHLAWLAGLGKAGAPTLEVEGVVGPIEEVVPP